MVDWMTQEMTVNAQSLTRYFDKGLNLASNCGQNGLFSDCKGEGSFAKFLAYLIWAEKVMPNAKWDFKDAIKKRFNLKTEDSLYMAVPGTSKSLYFDAWANIHYGFVGSAAGFSQKELQQAGNVHGLAGNNDQGDVITTQIGIDLYRKYGARGLTPERVNAAILKQLPALEALPGEDKVRER
jgi:hypothetical protein